MAVETLRVEGLKKLYGKKAAVLDVSFSMSNGEIVGLLGPNGAGKTTVFYMIVGFVRATSGKIFLNEHNITRRPMYRRARAGISYLPQEPSVFRKLTVEQNVWAILETRRDLSRKEKLRTLDQLMSELGIEHVRKQKAFTLSGGGTKTNRDRPIARDTAEVPPAR